MIGTRDSPPTHPHPELYVDLQQLSKKTPAADNSKVVRLHFASVSVPHVVHIFDNMTWPSIGRLLELYSLNKDINFDVEYRHCRKKLDGQYFVISKSRPEDSWTTIKRISPVTLPHLHKRIAALLFAYYDVSYVYLQLEMSSMKSFDTKRNAKASPDIFKVRW